MMQKEVIHLAFGPFAAHLTTHAFNSQAAHFTYSDQPSTSSSHAAPHQVLIDHDVDWRAGQGFHGNDTYTPRLVLFDTRQGYRGRRRYEGDYDDVPELIDDGEEQSRDRAELDDATISEVIEERGPVTWNSSVVLQRTEPRHDRSERAWSESSNTSRSPSPSPIASEASDEDEYENASQARAPPDQGGRGSPKASRPRRKRRFFRPKRPAPGWASYSLFDMHPRSARPLVATGLTGEIVAMQDHDEEDPGANVEAVTRMEGWDTGYAVAKNQEAHESVLEESVRWFAEDSDSLQGFKLCTTATDGFAGFTSFYLDQLADEYPKSSVMLWSAEWGNLRHDKLEGDARRRARIRALDLALSVAQLTTKATLYTPLCAPPIPHRRRAEPAVPPANAPSATDPWAMMAAATSARTTGPPQWAEHLSTKADFDNIYHATAYLQCHVETSTLCTRLKQREETMSSLCSRLNWRRDTPIAMLRGCAPTPLLAPAGDARTGLATTWDPIDALLASRGYGPSNLGGRSGAGRDDARESPRERAERAARTIREASVELSTLGGRQPLRRDGAAQTATALSPLSPTPPFAESVVARDANAAAESPTRDALEALLQPLDAPLGVAHFARVACRTPRSFPSLFARLTAEGRPMPVGGAGLSGRTATMSLGGSTADARAGPMTTAARPRLRSMPMVSSLRTSSDVAATLHWARRLVSRDVLGGHAPLGAWGLGTAAGYGVGGAGAASSEDNEGEVGGRDGLLEVRERLETLLAAYEDGGATGGASYGDGEGGDEEGYGTDEEGAEVDEEWELDVE